MLKALLMASVIIGAFLFQPVKADTDPDRFYSCEPGETVLFGIGCGKSAPLESCSITRITPGYPLGTRDFTSTSSLQSALNDLSTTQSAHACSEVFNGNTNSRVTKQFWTMSFDPPNCPPGAQTQLSVPVTFTHSATTTFTSKSNNVCTRTTSDSVIETLTKDIPVIYTRDGTPECPETHPLGPIYYDREPVIGNFCYRVPLDEPDPCPPDTVGDCEQPPEEPECSIAGNGMEVCPADPDEKCTSWVQDGQTYYDCPTNCGFINDQFFCTSNPDIPDIPDMSDCFKVATGYACPSDSPDPDDNIDNPNKPLPDMTKGDFKETNKGIETRLNATNKLLGDLTGIGAANNQALADLNAKQLTANGFLRDIRQNTADTAKNTGDIKDALTGDGLDLDDNHRGLIGGALGITGDESIDDLTKEEITLDSFRSEFQWSGGGGSCPAPRQINILGASFQMDWQPYCQAFAVASHFILAAAYFFAAFIAFGGRK